MNPILEVLIPIIVIGCIAFAYYNDGSEDKPIKGNAKQANHRRSSNRPRKRAIKRQANDKNLQNVLEEIPEEDDLLEVDEAILEGAELRQQMIEEQSQLNVMDNAEINDEVNATHQDLRDLIAAGSDPQSANQSLDEIQANIIVNQDSILSENQSLNLTSSQQTNQQDQQFLEEQNAEAGIQSEESSNQEREPEAEAD